MKQIHSGTLLYTINFIFCPDFVTNSEAVTRDVLPHMKSTDGRGNKATGYMWSSVNKAGRDIRGEKKEMNKDREGRAVFSAALPSFLSVA